MDLTITCSTSSARGPTNKRKKVAAAEKQLDSIGYRLTQERGRWPCLTTRLENTMNKTRESAQPLVKQIWSFLEEQLEVAEQREMTVGRFNTAANEVFIGGFLDGACEGRAKDQERPRDLEVLEPMLRKEVFERGVLCRKHHL